VTPQYQVVFQLPAESKSDFDTIVEIEDILLSTLEPPNIVEGHDFGAGQMNVFVHTADPGAVLAVALPALGSPRFPLLRVAYRAFDSDEYTVIYPANDTNGFRVT
jgi:hypothetical protein